MELKEYQIERREELGEAISKAITNKGYSKSGFAKVLDVNPSEVTRMTSGKCNLRMKRIIEIEIALGIEIIRVTKTT